MRFGTGESAVFALRGVTVSFEAGSFTAIVGPSGSGKSTLMHILAGLERPTEGRVQLAGRDLEGLGDRALTRLRRTHVGFIFQTFNLIGALSAEENLRLPLSIARGRVDTDWVAELLEAVGLTEYRSHRPGALSGGQQQRLAVARALVTRPSVVFADEPTGNLDSTASETILRLLTEANETFGQTIVIVTHDADVARRADRTLVLQDGRLREPETPEPGQVRAEWRPRRPKRW
jgi:putative ABC transport system ATP-binding protein